MVKNKSFLENNFFETRQIFREIKNVTSDIDEQLENVDFSNELYKLSRRLDFLSLF